MSMTSRPAAVDLTATKATKGATYGYSPASGASCASNFIAIVGDRSRPQFSSYSRLMNQSRSDQ